MSKATEVAYAIKCPHCDNRHREGDDPIDGIEFLEDVLAIREVRGVNYTGAVIVSSGYECYDEATKDQRFYCRKCERRFSSEGSTLHFI